MHDHLRAEHTSNSTVATEPHAHAALSAEHVRARTAAASSISETDSLKYMRWTRVDEGTRRGEIVEVAATVVDASLEERIMHDGG